MSAPGWRAIRHIEATWEAGQRQGELHDFEAARIRGGDYAAIIRELEPAFMPGGRHVVSWSRPHAHYDEMLGQAIRVPREPAMWAVVGQPIRKARGGWAVPLLEVVDRREPRRFIRRKPPVMATTVDDRTAHEQSNYQSSPVDAVDELMAVDDDDLAVFTAEAAVKRVLADHGNVEQKLAEIKHLPPRRRAIELMKLADDRGVDLRDDLRAFERRLQRRLGRAA